MGLRLQTFLLEHRDEIVRRWEQAVSTELRTVPRPELALRDHVARLLHELGAWVGNGGASGAAERLRAAAAEHAAQRLEHAFQLRQLVDELRLLRATVLRVLLDAEGAAGDGAGDVPPDRSAALARLNDALDFAIGGAVEHFAQERERRLREADEAARRRQAFLRRVLDATPSMVFVKDAAGRFTLGNEALARVYGTTEGGLVGKTDADFNPDAEQVAAFRRDDLEVITARREKHIPAEPVRTAEGEERWFSTVKVPLVNEDGTCDQVLVVATDITERKRAEEALRIADRQKDEFLAMLAHELRNPLAAIGSAARVIRTRLAHGESADRPLEVLERQVRNSARLIDDLLDVSRITRGTLQLKKEEVRLEAVVASAVDAQRPFIDAAGHQLEITLPAEPVVLEADPTRIEQVISNLLNNAAKYARERGRIALAVERREGDAVVRVKDDGIGIAPELLPRVFETFVQGEQPLARTKGGLGLGLTLVRRLVEMHGGTVEARSAGLGKGSEFSVRLPARPPPRPASPEPSAAARAHAARRIVLVEDNFDAAELLAEHLASLGHEVAVAHDGPSALELTERTDPEVVLLDIGLPGMDGYEVARRLRGRASPRRPVLIAITGYGQEEDRARSREAGIAHHLTKPFEASALERLIAEVPPRPQA